MKRLGSCPLVILLLVLGACANQHGQGQKAVDEVDGPPILRWEAFPSADDLKGDSQGFLARARQVTYDLRIYRDANGELLLDRRGIQEPQYVVDEVVLSEGLYRWTARPRFIVDGNMRIGQWSQDTSLERRALLPIPMYRFASFYFTERSL